MQLKIRQLVLGLFVLNFASPAFSYFEYRKNENLREEIADQPFRIFPKSEHWVFAIDSEVFKPYFPTDNPIYETDYNHGAGYWVDFRSEINVQDSLLINSKIVFTEGTSSFGPVEKAVILPFFGLSYRNRYNADHGLRFRIIDMGRVTLGNGLLIEEKETNGGRLTYYFGDHEFSFVVDSTGSYRVDGGIYSFLLNEKSDRYGAYVFLQEEIGFHYLPILSVYQKETLLKQDDLNWVFGSELAANTDSRSVSGLLYTQYQNQFERLKFKVKPQLRYYGDKILGELPGYIEQGYVSYEQNDKPYTTLMNLFTVDDHLVVGALNVRGDYQFNSFYSGFLDTELAAVHFYDVKSTFYPFYRAGLEFSLLNGDQCKVGLFTSNKFLTTSDTFSGTSSLIAMTTPNQNHFENKPLFIKIQHIGAYMSARF